MKRIAFFGPMNPAPSGISDYDEELLPLLRHYYEIDVFVDKSSGREDVSEHSEFYLRNKKNPYDLTLYQLGNSLIHETMYGYMFQYPGAVVLHDYCLQHARAKMLLMKGLFQEYLDEALYAHPEEPRLGKSVFGGMAGDLLFYYFPFVRLVMEASLAAGAHTGWVADQIKGYGTPVIKIPMAVNVGNVSETADSADGSIVLASFGMVTPEKRISTVLAVLQELRYFYPELRFFVVGEVAGNYNLQSEVEYLKLQNIVKITGRVERAEFHSLMNRADIVINLRHPSAREMSATLMRAMALGKPVLISRLLHLQEFPDDAIIRIRPDREQEDLFHKLWQLIESKTLRERIGSKAKEYMDLNHTPEKMVEKYRELIELSLQRKAAYRSPSLPIHLQSGEYIIREYIKKTAFGGTNSELLNWILPEN